MTPGPRYTCLSVGLPLQVMTVQTVLHADKEERNSLFQKLMGMVLFPKYITWRHERRAQPNPDICRSASFRLSGKGCAASHHSTVHVLTLVHARTELMSTVYPLAELGIMNPCLTQGGVKETTKLEAGILISCQLYS